MEEVIKMVLVGHSDAEKPQILWRLANDSSDSMISRLGMDFAMKKVCIDDDSVTLQIWDTAANANGCPSPAYIRGSRGIILVYNVSDRGSLESLELMWDVVQQRLSPESHCMLLGHKVDSEAARVVTVEEGRRFARDHGDMLFYEVCAETGEGISESFEALTRRILNKPEITSFRRRRGDEGPDANGLSGEKKSIPGRIREILRAPFGERKGESRLKKIFK